MAVQLFSSFGMRPRARILGAACLMLAALTFSGCSRRARVLDVHDHPAVLESGLNASTEATHAAVLKALNERGYQVESDDGRVVTARMTSGDVWAVMRIEADDGRYTITHEDSSPEFLYDPNRGTVHRRYNRWVKNLSGTIEDTLSESAEVDYVAPREKHTRAPVVLVAPAADCDTEAPPQAAQRAPEPAAVEPSEPASEPSAPPEPRTPGAIDM